MSASIPSASVGTLRQEEISNSSSRSLYSTQHSRSAEVTFSNVAAWSPQYTVAKCDTPCISQQQYMTAYAFSASGTCSIDNLAICTRFDMSCARHHTQAAGMSVTCPGRSHLVAVARALMVDRPMPGMELTLRLVRLPCKATAATASSDTFVQPCKDSTWTRA